MTDEDLAYLRNGGLPYFCQPRLVRVFQHRVRGHSVPFRRVVSEDRGRVSGGSKGEGTALLVVPGDGDLFCRLHFARVEAAKQRCFEVGVDEGHSVSAACNTVFVQQNFMYVVKFELLREIKWRSDIRHDGLRRSCR